MSYHVYRLFDKDDRLLYIGCSSDPEWRIRYYHAQPFARGGQAEHAFDLYLQYDHHTISEPFEERADALYAERSAIYAEQPPFNKQSKARPPARRVSASP